ncbi:MAG: hypothetical protein JWO20_3190, partial [Candidatus Angelobacter sp.]|nr:hypothetical protein [Candidatus Angelobacter sp.]
DGKLDLVVANNSQFSVSVLIGNGNGTFQPPVSYAGFPGISCVTVADLNGDGKLDFAATAQDGGVVGVLFGKGDGTFQGLKLISVGTGPISLEVADMNKDGKPDLLVLNKTANNLGVLLGNGDGTFQPAVFLGAGSPGFSTGSNQLVLSDFDGDGILDVGVVNSGAVISVLMGRGDGSFPAFTHAQLGANPVAIAKGDFNSDGKLDFAVVNQSAKSIGIYVGNGNGDFSNNNSYSTGMTPTSIAAADLNGDNKLDLVVTNSDDDNVSVFIGNGDGTFQPRVSYAVGSKPSAVAVADLNKDGKPDIIVVNRTTDSPGNSGTISVLLGKGDGTLNAASQTALFSARPVSLAVADLNGDGNLDVIVANELNSVLRILVGRGDGGFQQLLLTDNGTGGTSVIAVDMNNDLLPDLVVGYFDGVKVLINNGNFTFQPAAIYPAGIPLVVNSGDYNMDGKPDILALSNFNSVALLVNNGDGTLKPAIHFASSWNPVAVVNGDFNGDGALDAIVVNSNTNSAGVYLNAMATVLSVSSSPNASVYNQPVQVTSSVASFARGRAKPTGTVVIKADGIQLLSGAIGTTPLSVSKLFTTGTHDITVEYSGDSNFGPTTSSSIQTTDRAPVQATIQSSPNPSVAGNSVALSVVMAPQFGGQPTGNVIFRDGITLLKSTLLIDSLQGSTSTSLFQLGQRSLNAIYIGDANFLPSTSPSITQTVLSQASLSATALTFPVRIVGRTSPPSMITLSNIGGAPINISSIATPGPFQQSNNCGVSLGSLRSCAINVSFSPNAAGTLSGSLQITDSAAGSPHIINLSGVGLDFTLSLSRTARPSRSTAGNTESTGATLSIRGAIPSPVLLSCSGAPQGSICEVTPNFVNQANASTPLAVKLASTGLGKIPPGKYNLTIEARLGDEVQRMPVQLDIPSNDAQQKRSKRLVGNR